MNTMINYNSAMVTNITPIVSVHAMGGYQLHDWNLFAGIKPMVAHGQVTVTAPAAVDADGIMSYSQVKNSLVGGSPITYAGVKYQHNFKDGQIVGFRSTIASDGTRNARVYYSWVF